MNAKWTIPIKMKKSVQIEALRKPSQIPNINDIHISEITLPISCQVIIKTRIIM